MAWGEIRKMKWKIIFLLGAAIMLTGCQNFPIVESVNNSEKLGDIKLPGREFYQSLVSYSTGEDINDGNETRANNGEPTNASREFDNGEGDQVANEEATQMPAVEELVVLSEESEENEFLEETADLVVGVMADSHADAHNFWIIKEFAKKMLIAKPDFIIEAGDFIENRMRYKPIPKQNGLNDWRTADASLLKYEPRYHVVGNHEMISFGKRDYEKLINNSSYYSFIRSGYQFIVLDTLFNCVNGLAIESVNPMAGAYRGCISPIEKEWLETALSSHDKNIIFSHHPLYKIINNAEIGEILKKYSGKIILMANGHKHVPRKMKWLGIDCVDLPSIEIREQYTMIKLYGKKSQVEFLPLDIIPKNK